MNPSLIYSRYKNDALADKSKCSEYKTFVAMPFTDSFSYKYRSVLENVIIAAARVANKHQIAPSKKFADPEIIQEPKGASDITDDIVTKIVYSHFFIADLTSNNPGVLLETGLAMGMLPDSQIILITQGRLSDLHFDIRNNEVFCYNGPNAVDELALRFETAAKAFEKEVKLRITAIKEQLSSDSYAMLYWYYKNCTDANQQSLYIDMAKQIFNKPDETQCIIRFAIAIQELLEYKLIRTEYIKQQEEIHFGAHPTSLGKEFISGEFNNP